MKVRLQPKVDQEVADKLKEEALANGHEQVGPYVAWLLTQYVGGKVKLK